MALTSMQFTGEEASKAMLDGLTSRIRDELRKIILARIEPDIQAAVDAGLASFKGAIESYRDNAYMRDTIRVIIERRDTGGDVGGAPADRGGENG